MAIPLTTTPILHHFTVDAPNEDGDSLIVVYWQAYANNVLVEWAVPEERNETDTFVAATNMTSPASEAALLAKGYEM